MAKPEHQGAPPLTDEQRRFQHDQFVRMENERKRTRAPRLAPVDGTAAASYLLERFASEHGIERHGQNPKWEMFREIVTRCASDAAGNMYAVNEEGKKYNGFDDIFRDLLDEKQDSMGNRQRNLKSLKRNITPDVKSVETESPWRKLLNMLPLYRKGPVQTPHPTDTLSRKAIDAESNLHHVIDECRPLFKSEPPRLNAEQMGAVMMAMDKLYSDLTPVKETLKIPQEMARSIAFSEIMFNAIPHMMQSVIDPAIRHGARNTTPLTHDELSHFYNLMQPSTWSPGDRDSKQDMTAEMLEDGLRKNFRNLHLHYAFKLAEIISEMPDRKNRDNRPDAKTELSELLARELATIRLHVTGRSLEEIMGQYLETYAPPKDSNKFGTFRKARETLEAAVESSNGAEPFTDVGQLIERMENIRALQIKGVDDFPHYNGSPVLSKADVLLAQMHSFGNHALRVQIRENATMHERVIRHLVENLGDEAGEFTRLPRQRHDEPDDTYAERTRGQRKARAEELIEELNGDEGDYIRRHVTEMLDDIRPRLGEIKERVNNTPEAEQNTAAYRRDKAEAEFYETMSGFVLAARHPDAIPQYLIAECRSAADVLEAFALLKAAEPKDVKKRVDVVPLLEYRKPVENAVSIMEEVYANAYYRAHHEQIGLTNENAFMVEGFINQRKANEPDKYPERISRADAMRSQLPADATVEQHTAVDESITALDEKTMIPKVSVADVKHENDSAGMVKEGDETRYLVHPENKMTHQLTVGKVKAAYGLLLSQKELENLAPEEREKEEQQNKKLIEHTKMVMFAGSDIMKSAGPAGGALVQHHIEKLREAMLNWDNPVLLVEYTGCGSGVHRSQPVSSAFETVQGRAMRQTPESLAQKSIITMTRFLKRMLNIKGTTQQLAESGKPEDKAKVAKLAQLNMGNIAGFATQPQLWEEETGKRSTAWMDAYQEMYKSTEFACMMAYSADKFVKLTSYAARPAGRTDAAKDSEGYPPIVDVEKLRAIGYGAALNVSGSCALLYYGAGKYLHADAINKGDAGELEQLKKLYLKDPKAQDSINRATFGIVMADMDTAWAYLGCTRRVENGEVLIDTAPCADIAAGTEHIAYWKTKDRSKLSSEEKYALACHMLAKVDMEYQAVGKTLIALHSAVLKQEPPPADMGIRASLTSLLPKALKEQVKASHEHIGTARMMLAAEFNDSRVNEQHELRKKVSEIREDDKVFNPIYYRMGVNFECFENAPRAYTRPYWALGVETRGESPAAVGSRT